MTQGLKSGHSLRNGSYRIEKVLGQGSFGITYLATATFTTHGDLGWMDVKAKVAIKEFFMSEVNCRCKDGSSVDGSSGSVFINYRKKFKKEAENLSKLSHPNIVKVFDVFDENNTTYYVMEFFEGTNLDDYIKMNGFLSENEAITIINEIGKALEYMHSQKMLHLDIKPKNIMRKSNGKNYLIDFGLSKQFTEGGEPESSTSIGLGTPGYAPLEQAGFKQDGSFPATLDVYALGATMFKMLSGKRPPEATIILNEGFPYSELSNCRVSNNTISAVEHAMAPVKKKRYPNVTAFLKGLGSMDVEDYSTTESTRYPDTDSMPESTRNLKWIWYVASAIIVIGVIALFRINAGKDTHSSPTLAETEISTTVKANAPHHVTDMVWDSPLGLAIYTGAVERDSVGGSPKLIPHGKGIATISSGQYSGCRYEGIFDRGNMNGEATYTYKNGDTFVGTFKNNEYYTGRYTQISNGEYFEGTFKNGQPDKGSWYNKNGKLL